LLLAGAGLLLAEAKVSRASLAGWWLVGFSGWLAFLAKPTTALALAIVAAVYLLLSGKWKTPLLVVALVTAFVLALVSTWTIDGTVGGFVGRLIMGARDARLQEPLYVFGEIWRLDDFLLGQGEKAALAVMAGLVFLASFLGSSSRRGARLGGVALVCLFSGACIWFVTGQSFPRWASTQFRGMEFWAVPFGALLAALVCGRGNLLRFLAPGRLALALCLVALPHVCAFGSDGNYWRWGSRSAIFWALACMPFLALNTRGERPWGAFLPVAAGAQAITASLLFLSMENPYRQPQALRRDETVACIGAADSPLRVSRDVADYIDRLRRMARQAGFQPGDPMLDLTGHCPGALFALGAKSIGQPWMIGGYPGSLDLATASLDRVPREEIRGAWILVAPTDPRRLPTGLLNRYGLDPATDYEEVGTIDAPNGEYNYAVRQLLFKPVRPAAVPPR
jgi:hypothetical protein